MQHVLSWCIIGVYMLWNILMIKCQPSLIKNGREITIEKLSGKNQENTSQKMKFLIKDFFSKCDQICSFL